METAQCQVCMKMDNVSALNSTVQKSRYYGNVPDVMLPAWPKSEHIHHELEELLLYLQAVKTAGLDEMCTQRQEALFILAGMRPYGTQDLETMSGCKHKMAVPISTIFGTTLIAVLYHIHVYVQSIHPGRGIPAVWSCC